MPINMNPNAGGASWGAGGYNRNRANDPNFGWLDPYTGGRNLMRRISVDPFGGNPFQDYMGNRAQAAWYASMLGNPGAEAGEYAGPAMNMLQSGGAGIRGGILGGLQSLAGMARDLSTGAIDPSANNPVAMFVNSIMNDPGELGRMISAAYSGSNYIMQRAARNAIDRMMGGWQDQGGDSSFLEYLFGSRR